MHGVGVSCVNALSESLKASVHRDGKIWEQEYEKGVPLYPVKETGKTDKTGTIVTFKPDTTIFTDINEYNYDILASRLRELSFLNKGITMTLVDRRDKDKKSGEFQSEIFFSKEGLPEFI